MDDPSEKSGKLRPGLAARGPELGVAAFLLLLAVLVITDSLRVGIGWADDGPRSGYFPFYIGLLLLAASGTVFVSTLLQWRELTAVFAEREQLRTVFEMLVPMVVYVGTIALLGIYVASLLLIGYFMRRYSKFGWPVTALVSVGVPVVFFLVFERWFLVPLPKGPIENLLGF
ncbi:MAG TPA: tripartite tricarboxylate transporter TctB family protein [Rhizobacter sp.]|nr:tripartite tricarboxylate transporter TctB family protein [Rhizobacter sp.]